MVTSLVLNDNSCVGYRIDTPLGIFDIDHDKVGDLSSDKQEVLIKCKDGVLRTASELKYNQDIKDVSKNTGLQLYVKSMLKIPVGFDILNGNTLSRLNKYSVFNTRFCYNNIIKFLDSDFTNMLAFFAQIGLIPMVA